MSETPLLARLGLWRVTRRDAVRDLYEWASARGVFLAQLDLFRRPVGEGQGTPAPGVSDGVTVEVADVRDERPPRLQDAPVAPGDRVVVARRNGNTVGHCLLSDRRVYVPELHRRLDLPGAYCWRLYVDPAERGQGIGTAIVARALRWAEADGEATTVSALVGPDNLPSRRAFRRLGFRPTVRYTSAGAFGRERHRRRPLESDS